MKFELKSICNPLTIYNSRNLLMKFESPDKEKYLTIYNSRNLLMKFEGESQNTCALSTTVEIY